MNNNGPVGARAVAGQLAREVIQPVPPAVTPRTFTGDAADLVGRYTGPSRGREMVVEVSRNDEGVLVLSMNGSPPQPMPWLEGWTFGRPGAAMLTFERAGSTGPATLLRWDDGGGYYLLRRA
jgi:hypothetical protein